GGQVVGVPGAARQDLALERRLEEAVAAQLRADHEVRRDGAPDRARRARAEPAALRQTLVNPQLEAAFLRRLALELLEHRLRGPAGAILRGIERDVRRLPGHLADDDPSPHSVEPPRLDRVAETLESDAERVESRAEVRDRRRSEDLDPRSAGRRVHHLPPWSGRRAGAPWP